MKKTLFSCLFSICFFVCNVACTQVSDTKPNQFAATLLKGSVSNPDWSNGVSSAGVGFVENTIIIAGGTNFKGNNFSNHSEQCYYKEIYGAVIKGNQKKLKWIKLNDLPEPLAYSANVVANNALYLIGGSNNTGDKASFTEIKMVNGSWVKDTISYLPVLITKAGGAIINDYIYVVGGVQNGKASNDMYRINLGAIQKGWEKVAPYPDEPRIQPVVVSQKDANGKMKIYLWGGYQPKNGKNAPILSCGGFKYDPEKNAWTAIGAPLNKDNQRVYLGGGEAIAVGEDKIVAFGGASFERLWTELNGNDKEFYNHDAEWYNFNQGLYAFNTKTNRWQNMGYLPDLAKIHFGVAITGNTVYSLGGEIKPGTTTNQVIKVQF